MRPGLINWTRLSFRWRVSMPALVPMDHRSFFRLRSLEDQCQVVQQGRIDPNGTTTPARSVLLDAIRTKEYLLVRALLEAGADPNGRTDDETTPLIEALDHRSGTIAQLLLRHGARPTASGDATTHPLNAAEPRCCGPPGSTP